MFVRLLVRLLFCSHTPEWTLLIRAAKLEFMYTLNFFKNKLNKRIFYTFKSKNCSFKVCCMIFHPPSSFSFLWIIYFQPCIRRFRKKVLEICFIGPIYNKLYECCTAYILLQNQYYITFMGIGNASRYVNSTYKMEISDTKLQ